MDLSIIIVSWNTRELLARCLESVHDTAQGLALEVFVVDNASTDGSATMVRERFPQVQLIENSENVGFARANNQAIRQSRGSCLLLLNSDTEVKPGALRILLDFMDAHSQAGAAGARLLNSDGTLQPSCHPMLTPWREAWRLLFLERVWPRATYPMHRWDPTSPHPVEVIKGACLMLRRQALDQVGLMDPRYFMYTEEMDLCHRLSKAGWALYWVPSAQVVHHGASSTDQVAGRMYVELYRSKVQFHRKTGGKSRARLFKVLITAAYVPRLILAAAGSLVSATWKDRSRTYRQLVDELATM